MNRWSTLALLVLLTLDLGNPFLGGAFRFRADESVEVTQFARDQHAVPDASAVSTGRCPASAERLQRATGGQAVAHRRLVGVWVAGLHRAVTAAPDSSPRSEDDH